MLTFILVLSLEYLRHEKAVVKASSTKAMPVTDHLEAFQEALRENSQLRT